MCQPGGAYFPDFRAERFKLPYAFATFRPVMNDVRSAATPVTAPAVVSVPVFGYGVDIAITYSYQGEGHLAGRLKLLPPSVLSSAPRLLTGRSRLGAQTLANLMCRRCGRCLGRGRCDRARGRHHRR